jgi:hypothetical protein
LRIAGPHELNRLTGGRLGIGSSSLIAAVVASAFTFASISAEAPAGSFDAASLGGRLIQSVVGTIYSESGESSAPTGSQTAGVRLASLDTDVPAYTASATRERHTRAPMPETDRVFFDERFSSAFDAGLLSFDDRFGAATAGGRESMGRAPQRRLAMADPGGDNAARPDAAKRPNARVAMLAPGANPAATPAPNGAAKIKPTYPTDLRGDAILESLGSRTAIYDITARVVYLPGGEKLEAHSGLGEHMDDPRSVGVKNKGATPPNIYDLSMRERPFHGVRAIRLTPVEPDRMFGRDGILAHSHLLGPKGESNGCVSFADYPRFLDAYLNGEVERLVVVERLVDAPSSATAVGWLTQRVKALFKSS